MKFNVFVRIFLVFGVISVIPLRAMKKSETKEIFELTSHSSSSLSGSSMIQKSDVSTDKNISLEQCVDAIKKGNIAAVRECLKKDSLLKSARFDGKNPLHIAVLNDDTKMVIMLLEEGCNINAFDMKTSYTPLLYAVKNGSKEMVNTLITFNPDVNKASNSDGHTPLTLAVEKGFGSLVDLLLEAKANVDKERRSDGKTPLIVAVQKCNIELVKKLFAVNASVNKADKENKTALWWASSMGAKNLVESLLQKNASSAIEAKYFEGTPLKIAEKNQHTAICELLRSGKNKNNDNDQGRFFSAVKSGDVKNLQKCLQDGVCVNERNNDNETALHVAIKSGHTTLACHLLSLQDIEVNALAEGRETILHYAVEYQNIEVLRLLLSKSETKINEYNAICDTPLINACKKALNSKNSRKKNIEIIKALLSDSRVDLLLKDLLGQSALTLIKNDTELKNLFTQALLGNKNKLFEAEKKQKAWEISLDQTAEKVSKQLQKEAKIELEKERDDRKKLQQQEVTNEKEVALCLGELIVSVVKKVNKDQKQALKQKKLDKAKEKSDKAVVKKCLNDIVFEVEKTSNSEKSVIIPHSSIEDLLRQATIRYDERINNINNNGKAEQKNNEVNKTAIIPSNKGKENRNIMPIYNAYCEKNKPENKSKNESTAKWFNIQDHQENEGRRHYQALWEYAQRIQVLHGENPNTSAIEKLITHKRFILNEIQKKHPHSNLSRFGSGQFANEISLICSTCSFYGVVTPADAVDWAKKNSAI